MKRCALANLSIFSLLLGLAVPATAQEEGGGETPMVRVHGEWLYWNARKDDLDFAHSQSGSYLGNVHSVDPGYNSGYRVGGELLLTERTSLLVSFTQFQNSSSRKVVDPNGNLGGTHIIDDFQNADQGQIVLATGDWAIDYRTIDVNVGHTFDVRGRAELQPFLGLKYADIDQKFNILYSESINLTNETDTVHQTSDTSAWGANIGVNGRVELLSFLKLFGGLTYSPMVANTHRRFVYTSGNNGVAQTLDIDLAENSSKMISVIDLKIGTELVAYEGERLGATLTIGYQFQNWISHPGFMNFQSESGEQTLDRNSSNLTFDGLFLGALFAF